MSEKVEEYLGNVESYLITEAQKSFGSESVDHWLRRLEEANMQKQRRKNRRKQIYHRCSKRSKMGQN